MQSKSTTRPLRLYIYTYILAFISGSLIVASTPSMIILGLEILGMERIGQHPDETMIIVFIFGIFGIFLSFGLFVFLDYISSDPDNTSSKSQGDSSIETSYTKSVRKFFPPNEFNRAMKEFTIGNYRSAINRLTRLQKSGLLTPERELDVKLLLLRCHFQLKENAKMQSLLTEVLPSNEETLRLSLEDIHGAQSLLELFRLPLSTGNDIAKKQNGLIDKALHLDLNHLEVIQWNNWVIKQTAKYKNSELSKDSYRLMLRNYEKFLEKQKLD